jgi:hypothetical protein
MRDPAVKHSLREFTSHHQPSFFKFRVHFGIEDS